MDHFKIEQTVSLVSQIKMCVGLHSSKVNGHFVQRPRVVLCKKDLSVWVSISIDTVNGDVKHICLNRFKESKWDSLY